MTLTLNDPTILQHDTISDEWYTIFVKDGYPCGCGVNWPHKLATRGRIYIVVWPHKDDPNLLRDADCLQRLELEVEIVEYEDSMGPCISYYTPG